MNRLATIFDRIGLTWLVPLVKLITGPNRGYQVRAFLQVAGIPLFAIVLVIGTWQIVSKTVKFGTMEFPGPALIVERGVEQYRDWQSARERRVAYELDAIKTAAELKMSVEEVRKQMPFEEKKIFVDQVKLSLVTVFTGVALAMVVAIPIGIICGLSSTCFAMLNPLIQIFKPVSPLAWFPVVYLIANKVMDNGGPLPKSFLVAAVVVALCALWPALINTANGVANVEKDHLNVAKVLNLNFFQKVWRIVLPASLPSIFTGIRLSLGIGWMVLIAAEMMAVSPGLGGFIWDWYQSSNEIALSYLLLAVLVIGMIGFVLDRMMIAVQRILSHGATAAIR